MKARIHHRFPWQLVSDGQVVDHCLRLEDVWAPLEVTLRLPALRPRLCQGERLANPILLHPSRLQVMHGLFPTSPSRKRGTNQKAVMIPLMVHQGRTALLPLPFVVAFSPTTRACRRVKDVLMMVVSLAAFLLVRASELI